MSQMKGTWDGEAHERVEAPLVYEPLRIPMWREGGTHEHDEDGSGAPAMVRLGRGTGGLASSGLGFEHTRVGDAMVGKARTRTDVTSTDPMAMNG